VRRSISAAKLKFDLNFGGVVARAVHANVPLRRQSWEHAMQLLRNIDLHLDFCLMR
jgi:hypothetical protein